jgi:hypothetical protein
LINRPTLLSDFVDHDADRLVAADGQFRIAAVLAGAAIVGCRVAGMIVAAAGAVQSRVADRWSDPPLA